MYSISGFGPTMTTIISKTVETTPKTVPATASNMTFVTIKMTKNENTKNKIKLEKAEKQLLTENNHLFPNI